MAYMYLHVVVNSCLWRSEFKVVVAFDCSLLCLCAGECVCHRACLEVTG